MLCSGDSKCAGEQCQFIVHGVGFDSLMMQFVCEIKLLSDICIGLW
jgi:hypothetical protein